MLRTLLHKTLLTAIAILLGGWALVAQHNVVKGTALSFKAEENTTIDFRWEIYNIEAGTTINLASNTSITEKYTFDIEGNYEVRAYPVDKVSRCLGEPTLIQLAVIGDPPTLVFDDLSDIYCSANNGDNTRAEIECTVSYKGPLPWTFKYSVDSEPAVLPLGADKIWDSSFDFVVTILNTSGGLSDSEIMIVEAESISGLKVVEDTEEHLKGIRILPLPDTKFIDFEATVLVDYISTFTASVWDANTYEIFVPEGASYSDENSSLLSDGFHSELTFKVDWGGKLGAKQVKLIERNGFGCNGDTIYADVNVVEFIPFEVSLDDNISVCIKDKVVLSPVVTSDSDQKFTYFWSTSETDETITVTESGIYSVVVTGEGDQGITKRVETNVIFNALPIVDLGSDTNIPEGESMTLDAGVAVGSTYLWNDDAITQTIDVSDEGEYWVQITDNNGCINRDTITLSTGSVLVVDLIDYKEICEGVNAYISPTVTGVDVTYNWIPGGETESGIFVNKAGKYCVQVSDKDGNKETACVDVLINPSPVVDLGDDIKLDVNETALLDAGNDGVSYVWSINEIISTNEISSTLAVSSTGKYSVEVMDSDDCVGRDEVNVYSKGRRYLPSGFSPNGDNKNDQLTVKLYDNVKAMTFIIYNRGGQRMFQSNNIELMTDIGWDGTYKGELQRMDTYMYFLKVTLDDNTTEVQRGEVTLLR